MTPRLEQLLSKLGGIASEEMLRYYGDSQTTGICLETSRCMRVVLRHFGFDPRPVSVFINIHNPTTTEILLAGGSLADVERSWNNGGWTVGVRVTRAYPFFIDPVNNGYNAHLVLHVQDVLVDAAIRQYERPQHGILLPDLLVTAVPQTFFSLKEDVRTVVNGCLVVHSYTGDQKFRSMPGWSKKGGRNSRRVHDLVERDIVNRIVARVKNREAVVLQPTLPDIPETPQSHESQRPDERNRTTEVFV